jgi:hypothetical protein
MEQNGEFHLQKESWLARISTNWKKNLSEMGQGYLLAFFFFRQQMVNNQKIDII